MVDLLRELIHNAAATYRLKPGYYWLTTCVGFMAVGVALIGLVVLGMCLSALNSNTAVILLFASFVPILVLSTLLVAGAFGQIMVRLELFSPSEAWYYATRSRYPSHWFKDDQPETNSEHAETDGEHAETDNVLESFMERLPEGWHRSSAQIANKMDLQLALELQVGHFLDGAAVRVVAYRTGTDDILCWHIRQPRRFTVIHLSWSTTKQSQTDHPWVEADGTFEDFLDYDKKWHR